LGEFQKPSKFNKNRVFGTALRLLLNGIIMDGNKVNEILKKISFLIIGYEDGDLMLLSELLDSLQDLESEMEGFHYSKKILNILKGFIYGLIRKTVIKDFLDRFSHGVDLLVKISNNVQNEDNENPENNLINEIESFIGGNEKYADNSNSAKTGKKHEGAKDNPEYIIKSEPFKIFIVEAEEKILEAQDLILDLEKNLTNKDDINKLFRIFHTVKGECGFLKILSLGELTHNIENLLDMVRNDEIENSGEVIDILFDGIDHSKNIIKSLREGNVDAFDMMTFGDLNEKMEAQIHKVKKNIGEILKEEGKLSETDVEDILLKQKENFYTKKFGAIALEEKLINNDDIESTLEKQKTGRTRTEQNHENDSIIKVKSSQINYLVDMIGELLIAENQLDDRDKNVIHLKKISKEIQLAAMQLRTVKIKNLFINMKRLIRDLSKKLDKNIEAALTGEELEIDRNLVEILEEPLVHLLRNSIHHGIESEEERVKKNKEAIGLIALSAERKGNNIVISVKDDGRGLDEEKILSKAISKSLITKEEANTLSRNEIFDFIFLPGFSTAESVDSVSGRGVGMDIVKNVVNSSRGKIVIQSERDKYTEISLVFPLSMAIIDGMIVKAQDTNFIIPVSNIIESIRLEKGMIHRVQDEDNVIKLRQHIIPIIRLKDFFNMGDVLAGEMLLAVIIESREKQYAFIVNEIIAKKEIVIKPLSSKFKKLQGISSGTILPGGKIGFILDIDQIVEISGGIQNIN
jgi:two-component system, chemotaxis family, sensor kinase CheA